MQRLNFKMWFESADIFGFDPIPIEKSALRPSETPLYPFDIEKMISYLSEYQLPGREPSKTVTGRLQWGDGIGAIRVWLGTGLQIGIERMGLDLEGNQTWALKKMYQVNRSGYGGYEREVADELFGEIKEVDTNLLDRSVHECDLQGVVISVAGKLRRNSRDIFIFDGVRKLDDNNYIIKMEIRGQGVQRRGQKRVLENITQISFDKNKGKIRIINSCVDNKVGRDNHWWLQPADINLEFFPTQPKEEIAEAVATWMKWY